MYAETAGGAASSSTPWAAPATSEASRRPSSRLSRARSAKGRNTRPAWLRRMPRRERTNSEPPTACSSRRMRAVSAGWVTWSSRAAGPRRPVRATTMKASSWPMSMR